MNDPRQGEETQRTKKRTGRGEPTDNLERMIGRDMEEQHASRKEGEMNDKTQGVVVGQWYWQYPSL